MALAPMKVDLGNIYYFMLKLALIMMACFSIAVVAQENKSPLMLDAAQSGQWLKEISNWGRWGEKDQKGTLNLITPGKIIKAAALVKDGVSVSLSLDMAKTREGMEAIPFTPLTHSAYAETYGGVDFLFDKYTVDYHGWGITHLDALNHATYKGKGYNGFALDAAAKKSPKVLGIDNMANGVISRGVLIDIPWLKAVPFLKPGTVITVQDLMAWEEKTGIRVEPGDVVIIRTGRWRYWRDSGNLDGLAGLHFPVAKWLQERGVAVLGSDGVNDAYAVSSPEGEASKIGFPVHLLSLVGLGMPLIDNLDLEPVALKAELLGRHEFLFVALPLRVLGGTGSPVNVVAIF